MTSPSLIAVTGSTGALGGRVAARLAAAGVRQRLVVRDPARAPDLPNVEIAQATYDDADALREAFAGTDAVFLVSAAEHPDRVRQHLTAVDAVAAAGVDRVVYTSFLGAAPDATFTLARHHWATEERLREHDLAYTALRDSMYLDFLPFMAGAEGVIRGPADDGPRRDGGPRRHRRRRRRRAAQRRPRAGDVRRHGRRAAHHGRVGRRAVGGLRPSR